jgi:hypothetical protein
MLVEELCMRLFLSLTEKSNGPKLNHMILNDRKKIAADTRFSLASSLLRSSLRQSFLTLVCVPRHLMVMTFGTTKF